MNRTNIIAVVTKMRALNTAPICELNIHSGICSAHYRGTLIIPAIDKTNAISCNIRSLHRIYTIWVICLNHPLMKKVIILKYDAL